jgi:pilus assembly protein CpaC
MIATKARLGGSALFLLLSAPYGWTQVQPPNVTAPPIVRPAGGPIAIIKSQHMRLPFPKDVERIAVGDSEILSSELINDREALVLGRATGRTTLIVWFTDGSVRDYVFAVQRDLSVLQAALRRVHPSLDVESAPDRDALVLTGLVPNLTTSKTAEAVAQTYLDAGDVRRGATVMLYQGAPPASLPAPPAAAGVPGADVQPPSGAAAPAVSRLQGQVPPSGTIINLIRLEMLPLLPEEKIVEAIQKIGGRHITIRRILRGDLRDDSKDTLVLEGSVDTQIALVRVIEVAAQLFANQTITEDNIRVIADEAGALTNRTGDNQSQTSQLGGVNIAGLGSSGGSGASQLTNQVRRNLGRAKAIEAANGRILSFIEVTDLPQIRVDIRLLEVNRTKLLSWDPNSALLLSGFRQPSLNPAQSATAVQGTQAARVGGLGTSVQNVLSFLSGGLLNEFQFSAGHAAIDAALSLLERQGIARSLSSPSLTVLSGEVAQFSVGGQVPIPVAALVPFGVSTTQTSATTTSGVFSSVDFVAFGVSLGIRPLVGDDDTITLDVQPRVVTPDSSLTDTIRQTTGTAQLTTAFQTRSLRTSSRLQDGQALLIGGLTSSNSSNNTGSTPGARDVPGLGWLFRSFNQNDESTELVVVVNPVILRTPLRDAGMWAFPEHEELMRSVIASTRRQPKP